ncbi:Dhdh [Symbiodinium sp. CCMP2592]|nr:Dhdh [Symbiodinium sp. CCMP2592]
MASASRPRWGILGAGGICNDFAVGIVMAGGSISAVGASSVAKAEVLATKVKARQAHGSYEALVADPTVDVVYIGTIHTMHRPHALMALAAGKHVVCEKPLALNEAEAREIIDTARAKGLFLMEAMWTRFFPLTRKVREIVAGGGLGKPRCLQADFGFVGPSDVKHRLWDPSQAGGGMLDIGIYLVQLATMIFGLATADVKGTAVLTEQGVDSEGSLSICWKDSGTASLMYTLRAVTPERACIMFDGGYLTIEGPAHTPTSVTVSRSDGARGKVEPETFTVPLPSLTNGLTVNYPCSEGMVYEVEAVEACLKAGQLECQEYPLDESLAVLRIMDAFRQQVGVSYPGEHGSSCTVS